ncbi:Zn(2)-C6 fungal-type domain-containing protein [Mycena venus]|uniref:Zn(2)-C6 fungal-type domain-containing protein n=1 Tax=Mycena venus TaxID=2733690 RepID=A0A8H6XPT1_9AGAR|nr:Zn(2)-C6 fungal-type domain-containing protein [Mycena venus]
MESLPSTGLLYLPTDDKDKFTFPPGSKRRRLPGACDMCRQRKIRCNSAEMPGKICSNCISFNWHCTHQGVAAKDSDEYNGKTAKEHVDAILVQSTAYIAARDLRNILLDVSRYARNLEEELEKYKTSSRNHCIMTSRSPSCPDPDLASSKVTNPAPDGLTVLADDFQAMGFINARHRYFGRSSNLYLMQTAQKIKKEKDGLGFQPPSLIRRPVFWKSPYLYISFQWEIVPLPPIPIYTFPPQDLLDSLVSTYFRRVDMMMPLLHRPTFEQSIAAGLHLIDDSFGSVVLAVCALASRYSDDPRVIFQGTDTWLSAGWEWFSQLQEIRNFHTTPTLYDLQLLYLSIIYLNYSSIPASIWVLVGIGIRNLQELGVNVRKTEQMTWTIEDELYKRVFWNLFVADTICCAIFGRARALANDDYDVDYLIECDDEYWEHPDPRKRLRQPEGKPARVAFYNTYLRLMEILARVQQTIYAVERSNRSAGWSETIAVELDSALNEWVDSIPEHLRWDPHREDEMFATQSACLYATYYHGYCLHVLFESSTHFRAVQIQIHQSFIPSPTNEVPLSSSFPSLAICANSARACSNVMDAHAKRGIGLISQYHAVHALVDSAIVLLLNVWGAGRTGVSTDPQRVTCDVQKCINVLKLYESRWQVAGRHCDILFAVGNQLESRQAPSMTLKRSRDADSPWKIPDPNAASVTMNSEEKFPDTPVTADLYGLPISTQELGHLPVYESFDWGISFGSELLGAELASDEADAQQNAATNFDLASLLSADAAPSHTQVDLSAGNHAGDWATRAWFTYLSD